MREVLSLLHEEHDPSFRFDENLGVVHDDGVDLGAGHGLAVLADMESAAVDDLRNLLCLEAAVAFGEHVYYRFFDSHCSGVGRNLARL